MTTFVKEAGKNSQKLDWDEIAYRRKYRSLCAPEAVRKIMGQNEFLKSFYFSHSVMYLDVHLPNEDRCIIRGQSREALEDALNNPPTSKLLAFFELTRSNPELQNTLMYQDVPKDFTWTAGTWRRTARSKRLGLLQQVNPTASTTERYALYLLLANVPGPTGFDDLMTVNGIELPTFTEACIERGLMSLPRNANRTLTELSRLGTSKERRLTFAIMIIFNNYAKKPQNDDDPDNLDPEDLWNEHKDIFTEDLMQTANGNRDQAENLALKEIWYIIEGSNIRNCTLPQLVNVGNYQLPQATIPQTPRANSLNEEKKNAYDEIMRSIQCTPNNQHRLFFLSGCGGTGKTHLYNTLIVECSLMGIKVSASAFSGIASQQIINALTCHTTFQLKVEKPRDVSLYRSWMKRQSPQAQLLREAELIIIDEVSMMKLHHFNAIDQLLTDLMDRHNESFGGKTVVVSGDFRQTLPIMTDTLEGEVIPNCVFSHPE
ncbi:ATP-dependent DNA helicase [Frankliniella fusca]|uniref:ATP-dependent DNA helicase n=1 Tax=Frankliniella fusca TaxID=407009 RepID=A0AAE1HQ87_9NEOP|nr:ATP-dependent DNA helicase [Frankliniella fusca]